MRGALLATAEAPRSAHRAPIRSLRLGSSTRALHTLCLCLLASPALAGTFNVVQPARPTAHSNDLNRRGSAAQAAERWGLEWALLKEGFMVHVRGADQSMGMATAGELLRQYGPAYLLTSTSLAAVSYTGCYMAVNRGVNVVGLLARLGLKASAANKKFGAGSIAYVAHKVRLTTMQPRSTRPLIPASLCAPPRRRRPCQRLHRRPLRRCASRRRLPSRRWSQRSSSARVRSRARVGRAGRTRRI